MISRVATRPSVASAVSALRAAPMAGFHASAAPQASLRELESRVKSVRNIEKITKVRSHSVGREHDADTGAPQRFGAVFLSR